MSKRGKGPLTGNGFLALTFSRTISPERAGQILGCNRMTVVRMIDDGTIVAYRLRKNGRWFVSYDSVIAFKEKALSEPQN